MLYSKKSIVGIITPETELQSSFGPNPVYGGSGFVYDGKEGNIVYIVTNAHVLGDSATVKEEENSATVKVSFSNGSTYTAKVLGTDSQGDLAVL